MGYTKVKFITTIPQDLVIVFKVRFIYYQQ